MFQSLWYTPDHTLMNEIDKFPTLMEFTVLVTILLKLLSACCI